METRADSPTPEPAKKILVLSLGFDGSLANSKYKKGKVIAANTVLIDDIVKQIIAGDFAEVRIMNGSKRQDRTTDIFYSDFRDTESCFSALIAITEEINRQLEEAKHKPICYCDDYLLADTYGNKPEGENFKKALKNKKNYPFSHWILDTSKLTILYPQMHHIASAHENDLITFMFYDSNHFEEKDALKDLRNFFKPEENLHLIPHNLNLFLQDYSGDAIKMGEAIEGKGVIDYNYAENTLFMLNCAGRKNLKDKKEIDVSANLALDKFKEGRVLEKYDAEQLPGLIDDLDGIQEGVTGEEKNEPLSKLSDDDTASECLHETTSSESDNTTSEDEPTTEVEASSSSDEKNAYSSDKDNTIANPPVYSEDDFANTQIIMTTQKKIKLSSEEDEANSEEITAVLETSSSSEVDTDRAKTPTSQRSRRTYYRDDEDTAANSASSDDDELRDTREIMTTKNRIKPKSGRDNERDSLIAPLSSCEETYLGNLKASIKKLKKEIGPENDFAKALDELYSVLAVDIAKQEKQQVAQYKIVDSPANQLADRTASMLNDFINAPLDSHLTPEKHRLSTLLDYKKDCGQTSFFKNFFKSICVVVSAGIGFILGAAVGLAVGLMTGPGIVLTSAATSATLGIGAASLSSCLLFSPDRQTKRAKEVADEGKRWIEKNRRPI